MAFEKISSTIKKPLTYLALSVMIAYGGCSNNYKKEIDLKKSADSKMKTDYRGERAGLGAGLVGLAVGGPPGLMSGFVIGAGIEDYIEKAPERKAKKAYKIEQEKKGIIENKSILGTLGIEDTSRQRPFRQQPLIDQTEQIRTTQYYINQLKKTKAEREKRRYITDPNLIDAIREIKEKSKLRDDELKEKQSQEIKEAAREKMEEMKKQNGI